MKRRAFVLIFIAGCSLSSAGGFWLGFREAWPLATRAEFMPRGADAMDRLEAIASGDATKITTSLEFDVDNGLIYGYEVFNHPLRGLLQPLWGIEVYPHDEEYAVSLANYRKKHPSLAKADFFDTLSPGTEQDRKLLGQLGEVAQDRQAKLNLMVKRYATK